ncbi:SagB family peptide dehydrogenase [Fundidesulfovibrio terrae]|uniref:SagB family peptide dehydrogenase n=1 Tax=Fundidesulfovibrio terrae TaxID=2922866 RepID=UPI001FAFD1C1|nr:SagB family peptide dehydrogenase [Fundidesulfovibrio terrae]
MVIGARKYHFGVSHRRGRLSGMGLDWTNQPSLFKVYSGLDFIDLPRQADLPEVSLWSAMQPGATGALGAEGLSAVLFHAAGLTRSNAQRGGEFFYRACPSAGALYPCEIYLAWPGGDGLDAGVFHYDVARHGLTPLRTGFPDPKSLGLPERTAVQGEAVFFVTGIFFRNAWKYRARAYRYLNLDAGHVVEGLALGLGAYRTAHAVETDFDDAAVARLLGVDPSREGCLSAVRFSAHAGGQASGPGPLPEGVSGASRCALADTVPEEVLAVHEACARLERAQAAAPAVEHSRLGRGLIWHGLPGLPPPPERKHLFEAMSTRRSRRAYANTPLAGGVVSRLLLSLSGPLGHPAGHGAEDACLVGLLAGEPVQLLTGFSMLDRHGQRSGLRRDGNIVPVMAGICLDQLWMRDAAMHVLFFVDFTELELCLGDRGYRSSLQAAGRLGHRLYLAAESLGLGACGVGAFFDAEAADVLGLPEQAGMTYVVSLGVPRKG